MFKKEDFQDGDLIQIKGGWVGGQWCRLNKNKGEFISVINGITGGDLNVLDDSLCFNYSKDCAIPILITKIFRPDLPNARGDKKGGKLLYNRKKQEDNMAKEPIVIESTLENIRVLNEFLFKGVEQPSQKLVKSINGIPIVWKINHWRARKSEFYYYIDSCLNVVEDKEDMTEIDYERWIKGNYFKTSEEAENYKKKIQEVFKEGRE